MYHRGRQSLAHEYDARRQCIHCQTFEVAVNQMSLICIPRREEQLEVVNTDIEQRLDYFVKLFKMPKTSTPYDVLMRMISESGGVFAGGTSGK